MASMAKKGAGGERRGAKNVSVSSLVSHPSPRHIGLLGGSFNPAHAGHIHLSREAMRDLRLDKIIWLVSPQNPLKRKEDIAPYETRLAHAQRLTEACPFIEVSDYERRHDLYYSIDTIEALQRDFLRTRFVWLMGADNLMHFHRWYRWRDILAAIPIAVFDRAPFSHAALRRKAALSHARYRIPQREAARLSVLPPPAWCYLFMPRHPQSGTQLRKTLGADAFLCENSHCE